MYLCQVLLLTPLVAVVDRTVCLKVSKAATYIWLSYNTILLLFYPCSNESSKSYKSNSRDGHLYLLWCPLPNPSTVCQQHVMTVCTIVPVVALNMYLK